MTKIKKYQIKIESIDQKCLQLYINYLKTLLNLKKIKYIFFNLPIYQKKMIFLKSPHVNKKSKEHFSFSKYKLLCIFYDNNNNYKNILDRKSVV